MDHDQQRFEAAEMQSLDLLLEELLELSGYDFRNYSKASVWRRVTGLMRDTQFYSVEQMIPRVRADSHFRKRVLRRLSIPVSELFRDAAYFSYLREHVLPRFKDREVIKIWHAGCATGEEVYSMAILLKEAGLYERTILYGTDFNAEALHTAREGVYALSTIRKATAGYVASGGRHSFSDYYRAEYGLAKMNTRLLTNLQFSQHNLVSDGVFSEVDLVLCRNVLIYFDVSLQNRVVGLFDQCLAQDGVLCLGSSESLEFLSVRKRFSAMRPDLRIYRRRPELILAHSAD